MVVPPPYREAMGRFGASEGMTFASHEQGLQAEADGGVFFRQIG